MLAQHLYTIMLFQRLAIANKHRTAPTMPAPAPDVKTFVASFGSDMNPLTCLLLLNKTLAW